MRLYSFCFFALCCSVGFAQIESPTSYTNPRATLTEPLWQTSTTSFVHEPSYVTVSDNLVFHFQNHLLVATQVKDGKTRWAFEVSGNNDIIYQEGSIIFLDKTSVLYVLEAETGQALWAKSAWAGSAVFVSDKQVFVASFPSPFQGSIIAYDLETGTELWHLTGDDLPTFGIREILLATDDVVIVEGQAGGKLLHTIGAFDKQTGQPLWSTSDTGMHSYTRLVYEKDGILFFDRTYRDIGVTAPVILEAIRATTGETLATTSYGVDNSYTNGGVIYDNRFIALFTNPPGSTVKESIYEFPLNTFSDINEATATLQTEGDFGEWLLGPTNYFPKIFWRDGCLYGIYRDGQPTECWVNTTTEIAQLNLLEDLLIAGFVDGEVSIYPNDFPRSPATNIQTDARFFGEFRIVDDILLVQTESKLLAFRVF
jgi:outer membrane protein assembly factor BamB